MRRLTPPFQMNDFFSKRKMETVVRLFLHRKVVTSLWSLTLCLHDIQWCFSSLLVETTANWAVAHFRREGSSCGNNYLWLCSGPCGRRGDDFQS